MGMFKKRKKRRACVVGLDGVPFSLIQEMASSGVMPAMADLLKQSPFLKMKASLPEISAVSWTDFMTGKNSGTHGIFGFTDLKDNSYDLRFPNFSSVQTETFWDILGRHKKRSIVINQPSTYPARAIPGILISGFVALELSKAVSPQNLVSMLNELNYQIDIDTLKSREDHDFMWKELNNTLAGRQKAFDVLWEQDWDFFELVFTGTDRLHHFLWDAYQNREHPAHQKFLDYYHRIDAFLDSIIRRFLDVNGNLDGLFLLSDHGFAGIEQEVYLNAWLKKEGYLSFSSPSPNSLEEINPSSKAFAMDPNRIYLHDKGRYPKGHVLPGEKEDLKQEIAAKLDNLMYDGKKVVRQVFDASTIYSGPLVEKGPDLIVLSRSGFDMKGSVKKKDIFGRSKLQGMHTWDDAFLWSTSFGEQEDFSISMLSSKILSHLT